MTKEELKDQLSNSEKELMDLTAETKTEVYELETRIRVLNNTLREAKNAHELLAFQTKSKLKELAMQRRAEYLGSFSTYQEKQAYDRKMERQQNRDAKMLDAPKIKEAEVLERPTHEELQWAKAERVKPMNAFANEKEYYESQRKSLEIMQRYHAK